MQSYRRRIAFTIVLAIWFSLGLTASKAQCGDSRLAPKARLGLVSDWTVRPKIYTRFVEAYILACAGRKDVKVFHIDRHREALFCMGARLSQKMFWVRPTVMALINSGMSDTDHRPLSQTRQDACRISLGKIITRLQADGLNQLLIAWPAYAADSKLREKAFKYNTNLQQLRDIAAQVTKERQVEYVDIHTSMRNVIQRARAKELKHPISWGSKSWAPDLNPRGHLVIAYELLKTLGFDGTIGTISVDGTGVATASSGHKISNVVDGRIEIESSRYPFCLESSTRLITPFLPFYEELNRFILRVENLKATRATITWGGESHTYDAKTLKKGINLAVEFKRTPFDKPFKTLFQTILKKEHFEIMPGKLYKAISVSPLHAQIQGNPVARDALKAITTGLKTRWETLHDEILAACPPVSHVIIVTPHP